MYKPTQEEIAKLKAEHGEIFMLTVEDKACIMKTPSRKTLSYASVAGEKDPLKFNEVMLKQCFVVGDPEIRDDDKYFLGASTQMKDLIQVKESKLEKL